MRPKLCVALGCALSIGVAGPAGALSFNFTVANGTTLSAAQSAAFQTAANAWSNVLTDNITVNLQVGFTTLGSGILGQTSLAFTAPTAASVRTHLAADISSADDAQAFATLPTYAPGTQFALTNAQAKAIGIAADGNFDGTIEFNSAFNFSTSRNADGTIAAGTFDLVGVAEHEIGHALGFVSAVDSPALLHTVLDQYRYSSPGVRTTSTGAAYFSLDGGLTSIASFSDGISNQGSHWAPGTTSGGALALMIPALAPGQVENITLLDERAMDILGYNLARFSPAVPEPASWAMILAGFGMVGTALRRRQRIAVDFA